LFQARLGVTRQFLQPTGSDRERLGTDDPRAESGHALFSACLGIPVITAEPSVLFVTERTV